jgi:uncharacterized membrane protein YsdA (DUF1294 family)
LSRPSPRRRGKRAGAAPAAPSRRRIAGDLIALALVGAHAGLLLTMWRDAVVPGWLALAWLALSALTFAAYLRDKRAAQRAGAPRMPEVRLHLLELAGGWPGALLAQRRLRHKTRKGTFQFAFWACVVLHEATLLHLWKLLHGANAL